MTGGIEHVGTNKLVTSPTNLHSLIGILLK